MTALSKLLLLVSMITLLSLLSKTTLASEHIKVMALFTDKAMLFIDDKKKLLKKGQTFKGVKLIRSDSDSVVLEIDGEPRAFKLGTDISTRFKKLDPNKELVLWGDDFGMFHTSGSINNKSVKFLVDTGASTIAMSSLHAKKLNIPYKKGQAVRATTASGVSKGYSVYLNKVKVGSIVVYNVRAIVLEGSFPKTVLLGQTFLSRIHLTKDGGQMKLRKKF